MATRRNRSPAAATRLTGGGNSLCSLIPPSVNDQGMRDEIWRTGALPEESPTQKKESFKKARYWFRENGFVRMILLQRFAFYNYGFNVTEADGEALDEGFEREHLPTIRAYNRDAWHEWLRQDNVVGLWRTSGGKPLVKKPETIDYSDDFGEEVLRYRHGLSSEQLERLPNLTKAERERLARESELKLVHGDTLFQFEVLKRELVGCGLASTGLRPIFLAAGRQEHLEVSDSMLAFACRNIYEQHQLGYEIKSGTHAGSPAHHLKKPRADAITKSIKGKTGFQRLITNFDHKIIFGAGLPDPKLFASSRYDSIKDELVTWSMPLGQLLLMKSMNPYLMEMLRVQALSEREDYLKPHLESVFFKVFKRPLRVSWSNRCFQDMRVFVEMMKFGIQAGPVSQKALLEAMDLKQETERTNKRAEADAPDGEVTPRFDPAHGAEKKAGVPVGSRNGTT